MTARVAIERKLSRSRITSNLSSRGRGFVIELKLTVIHILTNQPPLLFVICVSQLSVLINIHCNHYGEFNRRFFKRPHLHSCSDIYIFRILSFIFLLRLNLTANKIENIHISENVTIVPLVWLNVLCNSFVSWKNKTNWNLVQRVRSLFILTHFRFVLESLFVVNLVEFVEVIRWIKTETRGQIIR
jgi:hypothetical protein